MGKIELNEEEIEMLGQAVANYAEETRNYNKREFPDEVSAHTALVLQEEDMKIQRLILKIHRAANP